MRLGRRIARTRALLIVTYRDDELAVDHPLRAVVGRLPATTCGSMVGFGRDEDYQGEAQLGILRRSIANAGVLGAPIVRTFNFWRAAEPTSRCRATCPSRRG